MEVKVRGKTIDVEHVVHIKPVNKYGAYSACYDHEIIVDRSTEPSLDACRVLKKRGLTGKLVTVLPSGMTGMVVDIEAGSKLTVRTNSIGRPAFAKILAGKYAFLPADAHEGEEGGEGA